MQRPTNEILGLFTRVQIYNSIHTSQQDEQSQWHHRFCSPWIALKFQIDPETNRNSFFSSAKQGAHIENLKITSKCTLNKARGFSYFFQFLCFLVCIGQTGEAFNLPIINPSDPKPQNDREDTGVFSNYRTLVLLLVKGQAQSDPQPLIMSHLTPPTSLGSGPCKMGTEMCRLCTVNDWLQRHQRPIVLHCDESPRDRAHSLVLHNRKKSPSQPQSSPSPYLQLPLPLSTNLAQGTKRWNCKSGSFHNLSLIQDDAILR